jgi:hypothetical protein
MAVLLCKAVIRLSNEPQAHIDPKQAIAPFMISLLAQETQTPLALSGHQFFWLHAP